MDSSRIHGICDECAKKIDWTTDNKFKNVMDEYAFDDVWPCCRYGFYARKIVSQLKFTGERCIARGIGLLLAERAFSEDMQIDMLVPVPMFKEKQAKRGFNQAELLARYAAKELGVPMACALEKRKNTVSMRMSAGQARTELQLDAFTVRNDMNIQGKNIVLVDDVITTGSTADACADALKDGGASSVAVLCFATSGGPRVSDRDELENDSKSYFENPNGAKENSIFIYE